MLMHAEEMGNGLETWQKKAWTSRTWPKNSLKPHNIDLCNGKSNIAQNDKQRQWGHFWCSGGGVLVDRRNTHTHTHWTGLSLATVCPLIRSLAIRPTVESCMLPKNAVQWFPAIISCHFQSMCVWPAMHCTYALIWSALRLPLFAFNARPQNDV